MYKQLFKASVDSIIITDLDGIIIEANPAAESMFESTPNGLLGLSVDTLYYEPHDLAKVTQSIEKSGAFTGTILNKTQKNNVFNSFLTANWYYDKDGEIKGIMGISRNINNEIGLKNEYQQLVNTVSDIIYTSNFEGQFTFINESVRNILGYRPEQLIGKSFLELIYPPHREAVQKHYQSHFDKKLTQSYLEFQVHKKDGDLLWVGQQVATKFDVVFPEQITGFYGVVRDIDKQKKTELLLAESEIKYRELFDSSSDLIQSIDPYGNFLYVNAAWKKTLKYTDLDLKTLNLFSIIHPESQEHCSVLLKDILQKGFCSEERIIYNLMSKTGQKVTVEGAISTTLKNDKVWSIQSFLRDVTIQKEAERKLAKQEKTLRQITETINDVFYHYNITDHSFEYISSNCKSVLGVSETFFYDGESYIRNVVFKEDRDTLREKASIIKDGYPYDLDYRIVVDGKIRWINEKSFPILNDKGKVIANSGVCRDITDLKKAHETIYLQHLEIGASIKYAKRLQDGVLPDDKTREKIFPDSFVLYRPKDVVSGDFYVVDYIRSNEKTKMPAFIVGDCTGHGVPGALLSLMCNVLIRESFSKYSINSPSEALEFVRKRLMKFFTSSNNMIIRDGMDIAFCVINPETNQMYFSGANSPCVIIRNGELIEIRGEKQHVGFTETEKPYTTHIIDLQPNDCIMLFSDGYIDQFGGEKRKKFTRKRFYNLLKENSNSSMDSLGKLLLTEHLNWKEGIEQIDDITVLGIRY